MRMRAIDRLAMLYYKGASLEDLATTRKVHKTTIKRRLERAGYVLRRPGPIPGMNMDRPR